MRLSGHQSVCSQHMHLNPVYVPYYIINGAGLKLAGGKNLIVIRKQRRSRRDYVPAVACYEEYSMHLEPDYGRQ